MEVLADLRNVTGALMGHRTMYKSSDGPWFAKFNGSDPAAYIQRNWERQLYQLNRELSNPLPTCIIRRVLSFVAPPSKAKRTASKVAMKSDRRRLSHVIRRGVRHWMDMNIS